MLVGISNKDFNNAGLHIKIYINNFITKNIILVGDRIRIFRIPCERPKQ